jgi:uncharacterized membrane protein
VYRYINQPKEIRYVKYYNDKLTMYMVSYNDNRSSDKWCSSIQHIQYFQGVRKINMTFHIWMGLLAILSSFVLSFLGVILMIHLDVWTGVLLIITGMVCLLRALPRIREDI